MASVSSAGMRLCPLCRGRLSAELAGSIPISLDCSGTKPPENPGSLLNQGLGLGPVGIANGSQRWIGGHGPSFNNPKLHP